MIVYYVSGLAIFLSATLMGIVLLIDRMKPETESKKEAQLRTKEAMETTKT